jgi:hypothetical protein
MEEFGGSISGKIQVFVMAVCFEVRARAQVKLNKGNFA